MELPNMDGVLDKLMPIAEKVAEKVGQGAAFAIEVVVRQVYVDAIKYGLWTFFGIILAYATYRATKSVWTEYKRTGDDDYVAPAIVVGFLGGVISLVVIFTNTYEVLARLINPYWYAVAKVIELTK